MRGLYGLQIKNEAKIGDVVVLAALFIRVRCITCNGKRRVDPRVQIAIHFAVNVSLGNCE